VCEAFAYHSQRYSTRRPRAEVQDQGHAVGRSRIRRVLKAHGLRAQQPGSSCTPILAASIRLPDSKPWLPNTAQSMSRRGNYYDNAHAESFWSRFKAELLDGSFPGLTEAKLQISHHIAYYNAEWRHSALGYLAPNHCETHLQTTSQRCPA
jgi:transposase InsO family protein